MAYIGNQPLAGAYSLITLTESFNGVLTDFTMSESVGSTNNLIVILSGVIQRWGTAFTVSGTTLTFTSPPATGETISILKLGDLLSIGIASASSVGLSQLSATGTASASTFLRGDNSWTAVEGSDISTEGVFFSNWTNITGNVTSTLTTSKNRMLIGPITVNDTYTWDIAGTGTLTML